jgi:predicted DNA-binding protein
MLTTSDTTKQSKLIGVRVTPQMYDYISSLAQKEQRTVSNYVRKILVDQIDETAYLTSTPANRKRLLKSIKSMKENKTVSKTLEELE